MDGNIEREAITSDLESMKEAGIDYVLFIEVNVGVPRGKVDFLSEEWQVNITGMVRNQNNHLEIEVANLWVNRLIGDEAGLWDGIKDGKWPEWLLNGTIRPSERYTFTTHRYYRKGDTLSESGLMGPVTIETLQ